MSKQSVLLAYPSGCGNQFVNELSHTLDDFFGKVTGAFGGALDFSNELNDTVSLISDQMRGLTGQISGVLEDKLVGFIQSGLSGVQSYFFSIYATNPLVALAQTKAFNAAALKPIQKLFGSFGCLGDIVAKSLTGSIKDMLVNAVKKGLINPVTCAVQDFIGGLTNKVTSAIDSVIGPLINPIDSLFGLIGQGFGTIKGALAGGLDIFNKASNILNCKDNNDKSACPVSNEYILKTQTKNPKSERQQQTIFSQAFAKGQKALQNVQEGATEFEKNVGSFKIFGSRIDSAEPVECNTGNVFECGPPRLEIFGGDGEGAAGDLILGNIIEKFDEESGGIVSDVQRTASIIGVDITYPGQGYTEEPLVAFVDNCDQGYGAYGRALIDKDPNSPTFGQLTDIIIISEGKNYPVDSDDEAYIEKIIVSSGGSGYSIDDTIDGFDVEIIDGSISKVTPNNIPYRTLPRITVNTKTGSGAKLTPIMTKVRRDTLSQQQIDCIQPKDNIVGYVNGQPYTGPFHIMPNGQKMTGESHSDADDFIYNTPQESFKSTVKLNTTPSNVKLKSIQQLVQESETTQTTSNETYVDPVDDSMDNDSPPPSSPPPSTPPISSPPSSGGGGYGGY